MPIELKMPALSPTMEEGTLAKWLVKEGDEVKSGDILAEIETDKATMEFEAVDEGTIAQILVPEGSDGVKVGALIAILAEEGEDAGSAKASVSGKSSAPAKAQAAADAPKSSEPLGSGAAPAAAVQSQSSPKDEGVKTTPPAPRPALPADPRVKASPLARRIASQQGIDLASIAGSGPSGRVVKADLDGARPSVASTADPSDASRAAPDVSEAPASSPSVPQATPAIPDIPHDVAKLSNMRKTIARRLTESKQQVPHIYLTVDIRLDGLLALREQLNKSLSAREIKLSVNDLLIKALGVALIEVPSCNVMLAGDQLVTFSRADISVAVSIPNGLITPVVSGANLKSVSAISTEFKDLAARARDGKLKPEEYQGGTASLSNMGMYGITQFSAVINPPQGMIMAIGAGDKRPWVGEDGGLTVASVMSATGSFDHRAIDGADGAKLMKVFKRLVESPFGIIA